MQTASVLSHPAKYIAICDDEAGYACHLMEYLKRRTSLPYEVSVFTSTEKLIRYAPPDRVILLIVSESEYIQGIPGRNYDPVLILNESDRYLGDGAPENVSKYQSMEFLAQKVGKMISEKEDYAPASIRHGPPLKCIGVYTPELKSNLRYKKTLYSLKIQRKMP